MKKFTIAAAAVLMALSLTACGADGDVSVTATPSPRLDQAPAVDTTPDGNDTVTGDGEVNRYDFKNGTSGRDTDKSGKADDPLTDGNVKNDIPGNEDGIEGLSGLI